MVSVAPILILTNNFIDSGQKMLHTIFWFHLIFIFPQYIKAQEVYGFDFQDNKVPKYLTEENGVAEVRIKVKIGKFIDRHI